MRGVADTNIIVSGLLWHGPPRAVLDAAQAGDVTLFTSGALLAELQDVLARPKFSQRLEHAGVTMDELVMGYAALATAVRPIAPFADGPASLSPPCRCRHLVTAGRSIPLAVSPVCYRLHFGPFPPP
jgi:putative PIN family toxin of toxin-antitoxin system